LAEAFGGAELGLDVDIRQEGEVERVFVLRRTEGLAGEASQ
jgi:hypothetical protein